VPAGASQDGGADCTYPIPASVFNDSANPACPSGPCKRVLIDFNCRGPQAVDGLGCWLQCYDGAAGYSRARCANGTWEEVYNDCGESSGMTVVQCAVMGPPVLGQHATLTCGQVSGLMTVAQRACWAVAHQHAHGLDSCLLRVVANMCAFIEACRAPTHMWRGVRAVRCMACRLQPFVGAVRLSPSALWGASVLLPPRPWLRHRQ
jgi:hypothetical protein